jgi:cell division protease FtsH
VRARFTTLTLLALMAFTVLVSGAPASSGQASAPSPTALPDRGPSESKSNLSLNGAPEPPPSSHKATAASKRKNEPPFGYGTLLGAAARHRVRSVSIDETTGAAQVVMRNGAKHQTTVPVGQSGDVADRLYHQGVDVSFANSGPDRGGSSPLLMMLVVFGFIGLMLFAVIRTSRRRAGKSAQHPRSAHGKLRDSAQLEGIPQERFSDVAGCDEAVEELREVLDFLRQPERFAKVGAKVDNGVLLHGPPGTGKTLLARALAGEAGIAFFAVSASEFVEMYVGVGASRIRALFQKARDAGGAVIFIDELDAIGRKRSDAVNGAHEEREQTLNQLLVELDGFEQREKVICVAATNRPDVLDPALTRPGRYANQIMIDRPGRQGRAQILALYVANKPLAEGVDIERLAEMTYGMTGADLADMVNRAAILCVRRGRELISQQDLDDGALWAIAGPEKKELVLGEGEERKIAYHESGHVLCAEYCQSHEKAHRTSIKQRSNTGGLAQYGQTDRLLHSRQILHEKLIVLFGGRAAEQELAGEISSGAQSDLQRAHMIARQAIEDLALSVDMGQMLPSGSASSERTRERVDDEVESWVNQAYMEALVLVREHRAELDALAEALLTNKDLSRVEIQAALADGRAETEPVPTQFPVPAPRPVTEPQARPQPRAATRRSVFERWRPRLPRVRRRQPARPVIATSTSKRSD